MNSSFITEIEENTDSFSIVGRTLGNGITQNSEPFRLPF